MPSSRRLPDNGTSRRSDPGIAPCAGKAGAGLFLPQRGRMSAQLTGEGENSQMLLFSALCADPAISLITRFAGASPAGGSTVTIPTAGREFVTLSIVRISHLHMFREGRVCQYVDYTCFFHNKHLDFLYAVERLQLFFQVFF